MLIALAGVLGLIFGSFGTVVAHRLPHGENIVSGRSRCPVCGHQITALENIPVLSWLALRGRCRGCKTRISPRYPAIELATAILFALAVAKFGLSVESVVYAGFFWALVVLTVIDLDHKLLLDKIVFPTFIFGWIGLVIAAFAGDEVGRLVDAVTGMLIFGIPFFLVGFLFPAGMGFGDVKLSFVLGTFLGYLGAPGVVLVGMFMAFLVGGIAGMAVLFAGGHRKTEVPFGPFLALGTILAVFVGQPIADWYAGSL